MQSYEKLGAFYLGRHYDLDKRKQEESLLLYDSKDLTTHAVCVGMTGSGKTGLCVGLLEEAAIDGVPAIVIDPKGDLGNLLLTFPDLAPGDFEPWVNPDDARRKGLSVEEYAGHQAELWEKGLESWGQDRDRIRRLREAADFAIYTPGSEAGLPVSILASFAPPPQAVLEDNDLLQERVATTATSLLGLLKIDADPIRSREHILLSTLFDHLWRRGESVDLGGLIQAIQAPPVERVGVLDLDVFYPAKERFELAMRLNNLLAAPGFQSWMEGEPLDVGQLLYTATGKPRVAIFSIAHLSEAERMFFVSLLLNQTLSWIRTRPGTTSLRALLYMDEIFGYIPPVAEPPSKRPFLTLLKQARAYGLGVVLATQNPVDLDYKGLSNTGTWFIGRLQTERDKMRMLEGLEGVAAGEGSFDRQGMEEMLAGLGKRVFLLHNVHEEAPAVFHTRWVMSYLRGPLTREHIKRLMGEKKASEPERSAEAPPAVPAAAPMGGAASRPVLGPDIRQVFLPARGARPESLVYQPAVVGLGRVHFVDRKTKQTLETAEPTLLLPLREGEVGLDWVDARETPVEEGDLETRPAAEAVWSALPSDATVARSYSGWSKELANHLYRTRSLDLFKSPTYKLVSEPGESERDFRIRLAELAREERDRKIEELRKKSASKAATLEERIRKARQAVEKEKEQASTQKLQAAINVGATLFSIFTGSKKLSSTNITKAKTAMRSVGMSGKESKDIQRAQETVGALTEQLEEISAELEAEIERLEERYDPQAEELQVSAIRPRKTDIEVRLVALAWAPYGPGADGALVPLWE